MEWLVLALNGELEEDADCFDQLGTVGGQDHLAFLLLLS